MGHRAPTATAPERAHLDSSPAGDNNPGHCSGPGPSTKGGLKEGTTAGQAQRQRPQPGHWCPKCPPQPPTQRKSLQTYREVSVGAVHRTRVEGSPPEAPGPRGGAAIRCLTPPSLLLQLTTGCLASLAPLPHATSARPTTLSFQTSAEAQSSGNQSGEQAPVPGTRARWARHQCPVGERKAVPSQAGVPSLNPPGPLCPPGQPEPGPATPPPHLAAGAN